MKLAAVIPCGGRSERMRDALRGATSKLFLETKDGTPIIVRSVLAMLEIVGNGSVVVVVPLGAESEFKEVVSNNCSDSQLAQLSFVSGGATRQASVCNGLELLASKDESVRPELVLIHDGARPFILREDVEKLLKEAGVVGIGSVAMTLATPLTNTVKRVRIGTNGEVVVIETPPRNELWEIQTPQLFSFDLILNAHRRYHDSDIEFTDDCQLVEAMGGEVRLVSGSRSNIKVTAPGDI